MNPINATQAYAGHTAEAAYGRWAPIYDLIFDLPFHPGRAAAARAAAEAAGPGGEILVVGVGTGLELPLLPGNVLVTGIDISAPMLRAARARVERKRLAQVKGLHVMDAAELEFPDAAFDVALAPYVMSVVPSPDRALAEAWRVLRPGGTLIIMNHFAASGGLRAGIERRMETAAAWLGWHPNFPYSAVGNWIESRPDARIVERSELAPMKLFTLLRIEKAGSAEERASAGVDASRLFPRTIELTLHAGRAFAALKKWNPCKIKKYVGARQAPFTALVEARAAALPSREEVIAFIGGAPAPNGERAPARVTKRDIARAFGVKGEAKAELKLLIKDLQAEGAVAHGRKALTVEGRLPSLVVADIAEKDRYGELIAKPVEWTGEEPAPRILVRRPA